MTKFEKSKFRVSSGYITYERSYVGEGVDHAFVARFKYQRGAANTFVTFLIKNFTVEEYFGRYDAGETPLDIVKSKGYLLPHIKKWLKRDGYPTTVEGYEAWFNARKEKYV